MGDKEEKKKQEAPPTKLGGKKNKKGVDSIMKLPTVTPLSKCRLRKLKLERIKDYLLLEEEFIRNQEKKKTRIEREREKQSNMDVNQTDNPQQRDLEKLMREKIEKLCGSPMQVADLEEIIDDEHAIISVQYQPNMYVPIMSFVDKDLLEPGCQVLISKDTYAVVGVLQDNTDPLISVMKVEKAPTETYADIGGLESQIQEIKEAVELPLTQPEIYEDMGIKPPKGVILYGPPGTGKTLLAKAVANQTSATFLRMVGSELIQKYSGEGPRLVRELFKAAEEHAPSIVFIDEIDAVGTKRYNTSSSGGQEVQRTMLELLNQLDGFDNRSDVKVILATNKIETLDPALIRPGRIDRKIEFPVPDLATKRRIFNIHVSKMSMADDVSLEDFVQSKDDLSGADIKAMCTEAGLLALRERRMKVTQEDFIKAKEKVLQLKRGNIPENIYI